MPNTSKLVKTFKSLLNKMKIIDQLEGDTGKVHYKGIAWKSLLRERAGTSRILIIKSVVRGVGIVRGTPIFSYLAKDESGRPVMISYLDGKHRIIKGQEDETKETV